ncbi:hypothetical protein T492DRAFT_838254 [Pavlovales sp. CCMP2436]|nr:hypothetical protein T492DRAFT_838254 [Pavlovales sp. CCMP2436]
MYLQKVSPMHSPRSKAGVALLNGAVHCVGGSGASGQGWHVLADRAPPDKSASLLPFTHMCAAAERLCPLHGSWQVLPPLATPRSGVGVGVLGGRLYAVGGTDDHTHAYKQRVNHKYMK